MPIYKVRDESGKVLGTIRLPIGTSDRIKIATESSEIEFRLGIIEEPELPGLGRRVSHCIKDNGRGLDFWKSVEGFQEQT